MTVSLTLSISLCLATISCQIFQVLGDSTSLGDDGSISSHCIKVDNDSKKLVCVCDTTFCDKLNFSWPENSGEAYLIQSAQNGLRFNVVNLPPTQSTIKNEPMCDDSVDHSAPNKIRVDLNSEHQTILGWGGAFTDAATININSLSEGSREKLLASYYGKYGLQYNIGRVPIAGTDFSTRAYSYDDTDGVDYNLTQWALAKEDVEFKIPQIKRASELRSEFSDVNLKLFASPWSPPKWMKTNNDFKRGHLIDDERVYESYANYLLKFFEAYREHGVKFWGATVQNEPVAANMPVYFFNSLQMNNQEMIRFVSQHLGPKLVANNYTRENFKLMVGDDSLGFVNHQVPTVLDDKEVQKYVAGLAFHWYLSGSIVSYDSLSKLVNSVKDKIEFVMMSEACTGAVPMMKHVDLGSWDRGQAYAEDIINDLLRQTGAWVDWNLALDMNGGPNWAGNFVDSPILVDSKKDQFYKQPMYYVLAHFSRFFKEGSTRVNAEVSESGFVFFKKIMTVAVYNKRTRHLIVNVLNKSKDKKDLEISVNGGPSSLTNATRSITVQGKSISTLVLKL